MIIEKLWKNSGAETDDLWLRQEFVLSLTLFPESVVSVKYTAKPCFQEDIVTSSTSVHLFWDALWVIGLGL